MSAELAILPERSRPRLSWEGAARFTLPGAILLTLLAELALAERKYGLFGGGFGQSQALDAPLEILAFAAAILACQTLLFWLAYRLIRRLHGRKGDSPLFHFNFAFLAGGGAIAILFAKYQALAFFSDAMSFQIIRNLGGGSLVEALLYVLSDAGLVLIALGGGAAFYLIALLFVRRATPALRDHYRLGRRPALAACLAVPALLFAANRVPDARAAAARFDGVIAVSTLLDRASDFDRDGWSFFSFPIDRQPFDPGRHPYALDIPGDGIDQDGVGGDFAFAGSAATAPPPVIAGARRHVVLIVLESTRADAIGRRVDGRELTPTLNALAARGSAARAAYSHVGFTTQSLQSLFTGELAPVDDRQSLVRDFLANGYEVGVFSGQAEDFGGTANLVGLRRGSIYVDGNTLIEERAFSFAAEGSVAVDGRILLREFDRRLGRREAWARPHFLYFNLQSAHFPYYEPMMDRVLPGEPIPRGQIGPANRDWTARTYWNAVAYNDRLIGALLARLRRLGVLDDTLVVVTADHGESLFDDGFLGHGHMLNEQQTRIPFILNEPGIAIPPVIGLADMRGLILRAAGASAPPAPRPAVFQYLGSLDRPGAIGTVDAAGARTIFSLFEESVWTSNSGRWARYAGLPAGSAERRAADAVLDEWARQRWLRHLREQPAPR
ncbi:MAG TPA: sulfatase-like hydrolase/transferase [Allosphingosinicella sp.]|nr:sulfatase-like hydrolase/transferase [Allosphingosinicella sp.]